MKLIALLFILMISSKLFAQPVQLQFPNNCTAEGFAVLNPQDNSTNSSLYTVSLTGAYTLVGSTNVQALNGIGMDGRLNKRYLWGMNAAALSGNSLPANLYRVGSDGQAVAWATIAPPPGGVANGVLAYAADLNPVSGVYYVPAVVINNFSFPVNYTFYLGTFNTDAATFGGVVTPTYTAVNLGNCSGYVSSFMNAYALYVLAGATGPEPAGLFQDLALNPAGNTIYGFMGIENVLLTINVAGGTATCISGPASNVSNGYTGCTGSTTCEIGGMFFNATGTLYAIQVDRGNTYTINTATGELTLLSSGGFPADSRGDASVCASISLIPTPVNFLSFTATTADCNVSVKWVTAQEINNDRFEIESSQDGINYHKITTVKSKGSNSSVNQDYSASLSLPAGLSFLRLKQIDMDGKYNYSKIITVTTACTEAWNKNVRVYPTLLEASIINIQFNTDRNYNMDFALYSTDGKLVLHKQQLTDAGSNKVEMNATNIGKGIYLLKIQSGDGKTFTTKITRK